MTVSIWFCVMMCVCVFFFAVETSGNALMPEKFPVNWYELAGFVCFAIALILWEIARK